MNTKIKICGIKRFLDIEYVNKFLPDYAGFIFADSKRKVSASFVKDAVGMLDLNISPVGVFADHQIDMLISTVLLCSLKVIQLHGSEDNDYILCIKDMIRKYKKDIEVWKAIPVFDESSINEVEKCAADRIVLDTKTSKGFGGTGETFDWNIAAKATRYKSIILAGGLDPLNIRKAIDTVYPFAVDVSSGVETNGVKDIDKIREFMKEAGSFYNINQ